MYVNTQARTKDTWRKKRRRDLIGVAGVGGNQPFFCLLISGGFVLFIWFRKLRVVSISGFFLGDFFVSVDNPSFFLLSLFVYSRQLHPCRSMPLFLHTIQRAMSSIEPGSKMRILLVIFFLLSYGICDVDIYIYICFCYPFFFWSNRLRCFRAGANKDFILCLVLSFFAESCVLLIVEVCFDIRSFMSSV